MLENVKRRIRRLVRKRDGDRRGQSDARIPEPPQPGGPERPDEADHVKPPKNEFAVPVTNKERRHDGWSEIRPRRPGEDTDMGRDLLPDITDPGRDLDEEKG